MAVHRLIYARPRSCTQQFLCFVVEKRHPLSPAEADAIHSSSTMPLKPPSQLQQQQEQPHSSSSGDGQLARRRKQVATASKRYRQRKNNEHHELKQAVQALTERVRQLEQEKVRKRSSHRC